jgi:hypothetical protein
MSVRRPRRTLTPSSHPGVGRPRSKSSACPRCQHVIAESASLAQAGADTAVTRSNRLRMCGRLPRDGSPDITPRRSSLEGAVPTRLASLDTLGTPAGCTGRGLGPLLCRLPRGHLPRLNVSMETQISDRLTYLSPESVVERNLGKVTLVTLASMRRAGSGPDWVRLVGRIRYPLPAVELFERKLALAGEVA